MVDNKWYNRLECLLFKYDKLVGKNRDEYIDS